MTSARRQLNIQVDGDLYAALEVMAFLEERAVADLVRDVVREHLSVADQDTIRQLLEARQRHQAVKSGDVAELQRKRRTRRDAT